MTIISRTGFLFACLLATASGGRLVTLEGDAVEGVISGIDAKGQVHLEGQAAVWDLESLRALQPEVRNVMLEEGPQQVWLTNGSRLFAEKITLSDENVVLETRLMGTLTLSIDYVWAVRFQPNELDSRFDEATSRLSQRDEDIIYVTGTGAAEMQETLGLVDHLGPEELTFDQGGELKTLLLENVHGMILASPLARASGLKDEVVCTVYLQDGTRWVAPIKKLENDVLTIAIDRSLDWDIPWPLVRRVNVQSNRLAYLSDRDTTKVFQEAIYAFPRTWKRDRSIRGGPLLLGENELFEKGLGAAGGTSLTFANDRVFDLFTASIGVDASRGGLGACEFIIAGDGREVFRQHVKGGDASAFIKLPIGSFREITLTVDPADGGLDLADDANWADACFIRLNQ